MTLATPYAAFLEVLAQGFLGIQSPTALLRSRDQNCESPVGSGPFKVVRWDRQNQVELVRNPDYNWAPPTAKHQGPAYLDRIVWKFIQEPSVRFASLQAGEVDVIEALPPESHEAARRNPDVDLIIAQRPGNPTNGTFNLRRAPSTTSACARPSCAAPMSKARSRACTSASSPRRWPAEHRHAVLQRRLRTQPGLRPGPRRQTAR